MRIKLVGVLKTERKKILETLENTSARKNKWQM